jgi:hypothetical protein
MDRVVHGQCITSGDDLGGFEFIEMGSGKQHRREEGDWKGGSIKNPGLLLHRASCN